MAGAVDTLAVVRRREHSGTASTQEASPSQVYGAGLLIPLGVLPPRAFESLRLRHIARSLGSGAREDRRERGAAVLIASLSASRRP